MTKLAGLRSLAVRQAKLASFRERGYQTEAKPVLLKGMTIRLKRNLADLANAPGEAEVNLAGLVSVVVRVRQS